MIQTVLGDIKASELGITMCHEHIAMDLSPVRKDDDSVFADKELILCELQKLKKLGAQSVIEVTSADMGRNVKALEYYAKASGLSIIASTGAYLSDYHPKWLCEASVLEIQNYFMSEITVGIENTSIKAGLIAEIATGRDVIQKTEEKVFKAAGRASNATDCAISTHCDRGMNGHRQIDLLVDNGAAEDNIILGHIDLSSNIEYQLSLLSRGVNIAFDTISKIKFRSDEDRIDNLVELLQHGYEDKIVLSQDVSRLSYFTKSGGLGYTAVLSSFVPSLKKHGVSENQIDKMLRQNPARIFDIKDAKYVFK